MRVLVTRPLRLAKSLCEKIESMGAIAELFPVIDIRPTPFQAQLTSAIANLHLADIAIFASRNAVHYCAPKIKAHWPKLPPILWLAIGPGTAKELQDHGIPRVLIPKTPPFETESLLALDALQKIEGKQIILFRGNGGRQLMAQVLQERGAKLQIIESYQRCLPNRDIIKKQDPWDPNSIQAIVFTSTDCLNNFLNLVGSGLPRVKEIPIVVVGLRLYDLARRLEFKKIIFVKDADDQSIMNVLMVLKEKTL